MADAALWVPCFQGLLRSALGCLLFAGPVVYPPPSRRFPTCDGRAERLSERLLQRAGRFSASSTPLWFARARPMVPLHIVKNAFGFAESDRIADSPVIVSLRVLAGTVTSHDANSCRDNLSGATERYCNRGLARRIAFIGHYYDLNPPKL